MTPELIHCSRAEEEFSAVYQQASSAGNKRQFVGIIPILKGFRNVPGIGVFATNPNQAPAVILPKGEHKVYTGRARTQFPYGINYHNNQIINATAVKNYYMTEYGGKIDWLYLVASCFE